MSRNIVSIIELEIENVDENTLPNPPQRLS